MKAGQIFDNVAKLNFAVIKHEMYNISLWEKNSFTHTILKWIASIESLRKSIYE